MYTSCSQRRFKAKLMYVRILILKQHFDSSVAYPTGTVPELKAKTKTCENLDKNLYIKIKSLSFILMFYDLCDQFLYKLMTTYLYAERNFLTVFRLNI